MGMDIIGKCLSSLHNIFLNSFRVVLVSWSLFAIKELSLCGYTLVSRLDRRDGRKQGGIALFASPKLADCTTLLEHASDDTHERSWHVLQGDFGPVLLCVWYRPPTSGEVLSISAFEAEWTRLSAG